MKLAFLSSLWTRKDYQSTHQGLPKSKPDKNPNLDKGKWAQWPAP